MSQTVRVALNAEAQEGATLAWPRRCPRCGSQHDLVDASARAGRVKSMMPNLLGGWTMKSDVLYLRFPMCRAHAGANELANKVLEKSPLMVLLRLIVYYGFLIIVMVLLTRGPRGAYRALADGPGFMIVLLAIGALGMALIVWARRGAAIWVVRLDPDDDLLTMRFADDRYAAEFKRLNPKATHPLATQVRPWYMRSALWKLGIIVALFVFIGTMASRR